MNNKYFENISTLEDLRKQYKELLKLHHPDNGGDLQIMQAVNAEYDRMFKMLKDRHENGSTENSNANTNYNNMKYDFTEDEKLREMLNKIVHFDGIDIELVGAWIWVSGNTYARLQQFHSKIHCCILNHIKESEKIYHEKICWILKKESYWIWVC